MSCFYNIQASYSLYFIVTVEILVEACYRSRRKFIRCCRSIS